MKMVSLILSLALMIGLIFAGAHSWAAGYRYGPYAAQVVRVIDGDTVEVDVRIWPGLVQRIRLRLEGVNTPEKRGKGVSICEKKGAQQATAFTRRFLSQGVRVAVSGVKPGKYAGRMLGRIAVNGKDLGKALITASLAKPYAGGKRESWC